MHNLRIMFADEEVPRARLALLLEHFSELSDDREPDRIMYPLAEVLLLVTCGTIASCDDFDDIVGWHSVRALAAQPGHSRRSGADRPLL